MIDVKCKGLADKAAFDKQEAKERAETLWNEIARNADTVAQLNAALDQQVKTIVTQIKIDEKERADGDDSLRSMIGSLQEMLVRVRGS